MRHALGRLRALADDRHFRVLVAMLPWLELEDGRYLMLSLRKKASRTRSWRGVSLLVVKEASPSPFGEQEFPGLHGRLVIDKG